jgi:hypothetical protein
MQLSEERISSLIDAASEKEALETRVNVIDHSKYPDSTPSTSLRLPCPICGTEYWTAVATDFLATSEPREIRQVLLRRILKECEVCHPDLAGVLEMQKSRKSK